MSDLCRELPWWGHILVFVFIFLWEFLLGVTKFGSTVQMLFVDPILAIIEWLRGRKNGPDKTI